MDSMLMESLMGSGMEEALDMLSTVINGMMWLIVLISIPALIIAVANCFFGVRIFRVLLVINTAVTAGTIGMSVLGIIAITKESNPVAPMIIGFILFAAAFGVLAWYGYKVFLFLQSFNVGISFVWAVGLPIVLGSVITDVIGAIAGEGGYYGSDPLSLVGSITGKMVALLVISLIVGIALGILSIMYSKWIVMGTTSYKGGAKIASILSLLAITKPAYLVIYFLLLVAFVVGGFCTQYFMDKKDPCNIENVNFKLFTRSQAQYQSQPYVQQQYAPQYAQPQQFAAAPVAALHPFLTGMDGQYKGCNFDIDRDTTIGRDVEKCNIVFPNTAAGVSKVQCQLILNPQTGAVAVVDRFSSYGTSVNGVKLSHDETKYLNAGDVITFGENNAFKVDYRG